MAKKSTRNSGVAREKRDLTKFCAFWGIVIAALLFVVAGVCSFFGVAGRIVGILDLLGKVALIIAIGIPAYNYTVGKKKGWKIVFWIALLIYVFGVVFGVLPNFKG